MKHDCFRNFTGGIMENSDRDNYDMIFSLMKKVGIQTDEWG